MDILGVAFLKWARDGRRTSEERFGILLLVEEVYSKLAHSAGYARPDFSQQSKIRKARSLNPAFSPQIEEWHLIFTAGKLGEVTELVFGLGEDRVLRDLSFLAFVPGLVSLQIGVLEREDLDGIQHLVALRKLSLTCGEVENYRALTFCTELREIEVRCSDPWPDLSALSELPRLEVLKWHGLISALESIPALPALRHIRAGGVANYESRPTSSVRNFHSLPEMPLLELFQGGWIYRLDGVERYPALRFMMVITYSKNLAPLAVLQQLTHLRVSNPRLEGLAEVSNFPALLHFALYCEHPQDWGVMMDSSTLREAWHFLDYARPVDLGMLQMVMPPWDDLFAEETPRAPAPLRLIVRGSTEDRGQKDCDIPAEFPDGPGGWHGNLGMQESEVSWAIRRFSSALEAAGFLRLQGVRMEKVNEGPFHIFTSSAMVGMRRILSISLLKTEAISRIPGIVACLRESMAGMLHRWQVHFMCNPEPDAESWDESWRHVSDEEKSHREAANERDHKYQAECRSILLEDRLRAKMHLELGGDSADFVPTPMPPAPQWTKFASEAEDENEEEKENDQDGGIAEFDPDKAHLDESWLPLVKISDPNRDWTDLHCMFYLDEDAIRMHVNNRGVAAIADLCDVVPEREENH